MENKKCTTCKEVKPTTEFNQNKGKATSNCLICHNIRMAKRPKGKYGYKRKARRAVTTAFNANGYIKPDRTEKILGCDWETFKAHIESQFLPGMTWLNHGDLWDIDHRVPMSTANCETKAMLLNHYTNLQPLFWRWNIEKSDSLTWTPEDSKYKYDVNDTRKNFEKNSI